MSKTKYHSVSWPVYSSLFAGLILALLPVTGWVESFRPNLVLMVIVYWAIYRPDSLGLGVAWIVGLVHDSITVSLIGQHALIYVIVVFVLNIGSVKTKNYAFLEYITWLILFIVFDAVISMLFNWVLHQTELDWTIIYSVIGSIAIWPWLYILLNIFENVVAEIRQ